MDESLGELIVQISADMTQLQAGLNNAAKAVSDFANKDVSTFTDNIQKGFVNAVQTAAHELESMGKSLTTVGRSLNQLSGIFTLAGATGMAPFVLALHDTQKVLPAVGSAMANLIDLGQQFYESIAKSILPVVEQFTRSLNGLLQWFLSLPQSMRDTITQQILMNSAMLVGLGIITKVGAEIVRLTGDILKLSGEFLNFISPLLSLNPLLLAFIGIVAIIITALGGWNDAMKILVNTLEVLWHAVSIGAHTAALAFIDLARVVVNTEEAIAKALMNLPGVNKTVVQQSIDWWENLRIKLKNMADSQIPAIGDSFKKIGNIITTGSGEWSANLDKFFKLAENGIAAWKLGSDKVTTSVKTWGDSIKATVSDLSLLQSQMQSYGGESASMAKAAAALAIGLAIVNTAIGVTDRFANKEGFPWPVPAILAGVVAAAGAIQIATIASQGFAEGTDNVPSMLSSGEMVVPGTFAGAIRAGKLSLSGGGNTNNNSSVNGDTNINVTINTAINSDSDIKKIAQEIAFNTNRELQFIRRRQR